MVIFLLGLLHKYSSITLCTDYVAIGPRFSNSVLQAILVLLRKIPPVVVSIRSMYEYITLFYPALSVGV